MRRTRLVISLASLIVFSWLAVPALAQDSKTARGTVTAFGADSITVKTADREMKFMVDAKTVLTASGAGTAARKAAASGKPGLNLTDFVKSGDVVEISYVETGGMMHATSIRHAPAGSASAPSASAADRTETATGTVESISKSTLTLTGTISGGGSFKQSYTVDGSTKVIAEGAGTSAAKQAGKVALTDFVGVGDQVTVTYRQAGTALHADEVRVRMKKK